MRVRTAHHHGELSVKDVHHPPCFVAAAGKRGVNEVAGYLKVYVFSVGDSKSLSNLATFNQLIVSLSVSMKGLLNNLYADIRMSMD